jgi:hypothetical protein
MVFVRVQVVGIGVELVQFEVFGETFSADAGWAGRRLEAERPGVA